MMRCDADGFGTAEEGCCDAPELVYVSLKGPTEDDGRHQRLNVLVSMRHDEVVTPTFALLKAPTFVFVQHGSGARRFRHHDGLSNAGAVLNAFQAGNDT
eukprot:scaffold503_cov375-Pinguiococcus_pyrenoidosus.AAC.11